MMTTGTFRFLIGSSPLIKLAAITYVFNTFSLSQFYRHRKEEGSQWASSVGMMSGCGQWVWSVVPGKVQELHRTETGHKDYCCSLGGDWHVKTAGER